MSTENSLASHLTLCRLFWGCGCAQQISDKQKDPQYE